MGMHKSEESLRVAMRENASMFSEEGYERNYDGFDPNDPDTYIALSLRQNVNLDASLTLGRRHPIPVSGSESGGKTAA